MERWRRHLNSLLSDAPRWVALLNDAAVDAVGPCLLDHADYGVAFFAGNFWLAQSDYLRSLPSYAEFLQRPPSGWPEARSRYLAELAINRAGSMRAQATDGLIFSMDDIRDSSIPRSSQ